jgi:hypothetical protein
MTEKKIFNSTNGAPETLQETPQEAPQATHPAAAGLHAAQAQLAVSTSELLTSYHDKVAQIRDETTLDDGPYNEHLPEDAKQEIVNTRKREAADKLHEETRQAYEQAFDKFAEQVEKHTAGLRTALFGMSESGSAALTQAVTADEGKLLQMVELGALTGTTSLARAALAAAVTRGDAPTVVLSYLERFPQDEELLRAYQQAPDRAWIQERKARVDTLLKPATADQLTSRPQVTPFG